MTNKVFGYCILSFKEITNTKGKISLLLTPIAGEFPLNRKWGNYEYYSRFNIDYNKLYEVRIVEQPNKGWGRQFNHEIIRTWEKSIPDAIKAYGEVKYISVETFDTIG